MKTIIVVRENLHQAHEQATECVMALGYFDGVHLGHQKVIQVARAEAKRRDLPLAVMSFRPHPLTILSGGKHQIANLMTLSEKEKKLACLGVDYFYLVEFTQEVAKLSPKGFVKQYLQNLHVVHAVAGFDFTYGAKGAGHLQGISNDSAGQINVTEVQCVEFQGEKISSTAIRTRLMKQLVHEVPNFLGNHYEVKATWDGFNLKRFEQTMLPKPGCYEVEVTQHPHLFKTMIEVKGHGQLCTVGKWPIELKGMVIIKWLQFVYEQAQLLPRHLA